VILAVLEMWPEAVKEKGTLGTPLLLAARKQLPVETQAQLLVALASLGQLSKDDIALVGSSGCLRNLAKALETPEGLVQFQAWLTATPNVIACCLSLAHAMRQRIAMEPSRRALYNRTTERLMDVATELGLCLDVKQSRIEDRKEVKEAVQALLQPDPLATLSLAVRMHDIETVGVPWILDFSQTMDGNSLLFMGEAWAEGGGTEGNPMAGPGARPFAVAELVTILGLIWPFELVTGYFYLCAALNNPLLSFRAPAARYWFDTGVYLAFVLSFSNALLLGPDTSGLGPAVTIYATLWAAASFLQELGQWYQEPRVYFEDYWNWLEMVSPLLVGAGLVFNEVLDDADTAREVHSWVALILWIRLLQIFERFESVGPLVAVILRMLKLMFNFAALCAVLIAAWSMGMYALLRDTDALMEEDWTKEYSSLQSTVFTLFRVYLGEQSYSFTGAEHKLAAHIMYGAYLMLIGVLVLNLIIALLGAELPEASDIDKEFDFTQTKATLRMRERVDGHELPPPLNLLQVPTTLWDWWTGQDWRRGGQRVAWLCWSVLALPVLIVMYFVVGSLFCVAAAFQVGEMPSVKEGIRWQVPLIEKLNPQGPWFKLLMGLTLGVLGPLFIAPLMALPMIIRLPVLWCKILFCMDVGLTFEVGFVRYICIHQSLLSLSTKNVPCLLYCSHGNETSRPSRHAQPAASIGRISTGAT
jgi:hypothetical protein